MILFAGNNSNAGGIAKIFVVIGGMFVALFRMCGSKMDDVGRLAGKSDDFYHASQFDDLARNTRRGAGGLEDLYTLGDDVAGKRIKDFEVIYMDDLDESSTILKSYESTKGLSPSMRLQMMQTELLPVSVRQVLSEPGGEELYALMMGKKLDIHEANALRKLFNIPFKASDEAFDEFVYLKRAAKNTDGETFDETNLRLIDEMNQTKSGLKDVDVRTTRGTDNYRRMSESAREPFVRGKNVLIENHLDLELEKELLRFGVRHLHRMHSFSKLFKKDASLMEIWLYAPKDDAEFMEHYEVSKSEMKTMRANMKQLDKKSGFRLLASLEELKTEKLKMVDGVINPSIGICNLSKVLNYQEAFVSRNISILSVLGFDPVLQDSLDYDTHVVAFRPLMSALKKTTSIDDLSVTGVLEQITDDYGLAIEKNSGGKLRSIITIHFYAGAELFDVVYSE